MTTNEYALSVENLTVAYGGVVAVSDVSFTVPLGGAVALLGANGAGKSTILKAISGQTKPRSGQIKQDGRNLVGLRPDQTLAGGVAHVLEGRQVFANMTVLDNLRLGASKRGIDKSDETLEMLLGHFPILAEKSSQLAGQLSGGQQQMVAISRALMSRPALLLLDEPSLGLAPVMLPTIVQLIKWAKETFEASVLIVEQYTSLALEIAPYGYVMRNGQIVASGAREELTEGVISEAYFGENA